MLKRTGGESSGFGGAALSIFFSDSTSIFIEDQGEKGPKEESRLSRFKSNAVEFAILSHKE